MQLNYLSMWYYNIREVTLHLILITGIIIKLLFECDYVNYQ
jgi:hypothetical protein